MPAATVCPVKLRDSDERRCESSECVRQRSSLRHRRHGNPHTHCEPNERTDYQPGDDPCKGNNLVMHQRPNDGHQHADLGEVHPAFRGFWMAQSLQSEDEEDRSEEVAKFYKV